MTAEKLPSFDYKVAVSKDGEEQGKHTPFPHYITYEEHQLESTDYELEIEGSDSEMYGLEGDPENVASSIVDTTTQCFSLISDGDELPANFDLNESEEVVIDSSNQLGSTADFTEAIVWKHVDEAIENVIQVYSSTVTEEELSQAHVNEKKKRPKSSDPLSLPFQYAGQNFNEQSQKLILNALHFLKLHRIDTYLEDRIKTPQEKTARLLNISTSVIRKLRNNWKQGVLEQAAKRRHMKKRILDNVSEADEAALRNIIHGMISAGETPYIPSILKAARERVNFVGSRTSFRRILKRMGFKYTKEGKKLVLIESSQISSHASNAPSRNAAISQEKASNGQNNRGNTSLKRKLVNLPLKQPIDSSLNSISSANAKNNMLPSSFKDEVPIEFDIQLREQNAEMSALTPVQVPHDAGSINLNSFLIEPDSSILPGEYVFELDGENLCFRLVTAEDMTEIDES